MSVHIWVGSCLHTYLGTTLNRSWNYSDFLCSSVTESTFLLWCNMWKYSWGKPEKQQNWIIKSQEFSLCTFWLVSYIQRHSQKDIGISKNALFQYIRVKTCSGNTNWLNSFSSDTFHFNSQFTVFFSSMAHYMLKIQAILSPSIPCRSFLINKTSQSKTKKR